MCNPSPESLLRSALKVCSDSFCALIIFETLVLYKTFTYLLCKTLKLVKPKLYCVLRVKYELFF